MWSANFFLCFTALVLSNSFICTLQQESGDKESDLAKDAKKLRDAIEGLGTDESTIVTVLSSRTNAERQKIARLYLQQFDRNLIKDLAGDLSGTLKRVVMALMMDPIEYLASSLHDSFDRILQDNNCIISILCTKNRYELNSIMMKYSNMYNKTLMSEIDELTDGDYKRFMKNVLSPKRREIGLVDLTRAKEQVKLIPTKKDDCGISTNIRFMEMMAKESFEQLRSVFFEYESSHNDTIENVLSLHCTDKLVVDAYSTVVDFAKNPAAYYAKTINKAMVGVGTDDDTLIRTIVSRQEIDLNDIKLAYNRMYKTSLSSAVASETSGNYKKILLRLVGAE